MFVRVEVFGHYFEFGQTTEPAAEPPHIEHLPYPMQVTPLDFTGFMPVEEFSARMAGPSDNPPRRHP